MRGRCWYGARVEGRGAGGGGARLMRGLYRFAYDIINELIRSRRHGCCCRLCRVTDRLLRERGSGRRR
jgi:hypothetical protein